VRKTVWTAFATGLWLVFCVSLAHAHGDMVGPDEMGPPAAISLALGISGYWLMTLWPFYRRRRANGQVLKRQK